jgi:hypothetical protein
MSVVVWVPDVNETDLDNSENEKQSIAVWSNE